MSHKIKITFKDNKTKIQKNQKGLVDKISINLGEEDKKKTKPENNYQELIEKIQFPDQVLRSSQIQKKIKMF